MMRVCHVSCQRNYFEDEACRDTRGVAVITEKEIGSRTWAIADVYSS